MSDVFNEVDEEIRTDKYRAIYDKYGRKIIFSISVFVVVIAVYLYIKDSKEKKIEAIGGNLLQAVMQEQSSNHNYEKKLLEISNSNELGFANLAKLKLASNYSKNNSNKDAIKVLDEVIQTSNSKDFIHRLALSTSVLYLLDINDTAEIENRIVELKKFGRGWEMLAVEIEGYKNLISGERKLSRDSFVQVLENEATFSGSRSRVKELLLLFPEKD